MACVSLGTLSGICRGRCRTAIGEEQASSFNMSAVIPTPGATPLPAKTTRIAMRSGTSITTMTKPTATSTCDRFYRCAPSSCRQNQPVEWTESWVTRVHCGRRWCFQRFVPPCLMSALISRFYGMGKRGSACLSQRSIYIKVPIGAVSNNSNNKRSSRRRVDVG